MWGGLANSTRGVVVTARLDGLQVSLAASVVGTTMEGNDDAFLSTAGRDVLDLIDNCILDALDMAG
ncbi:hypothetical protein CPY51_00025 [Rhizobium tubonense]|uniref:Uncharacterized protein n=1 Tax=Rhizobium tubonense TaxID=484088 RepID=A0A2W4D132_9HYPH|nr:hypothetical protein CPY51_00025 [Rhizobium tubonense]